ncbi:uncharacterized protein LOC121377019 [Gigantopelta aegis]|uniref:uncharacterized protein LOC121377019 n=1 Tax=Gigantopelta aegis TaxID=1735272 RepID=UPI001B889189|nr:uncharacterized protein LOC121377019 [Gigantopelta aegis]
MFFVQCILAVTMATFLVTAKPPEGNMTPCLKEQEAAQSSGQLGVFTPRCTATGEYAKMQCFGATCYCVNASGTKIPGSEVTKPKEPDCNENMTPCLKEQKAAQSSGQLGVFTPRCTATGEYAKMQCFETMCYCVNASGTKIPGSEVTKPKEPDCNENMTPCLKERKAAQSSGLLGVFTPRCTATGEYAKMQCFEMMCYCVNASGTKIPGSEVTKPKEPDCNDKEPAPTKESTKDIESAPTTESSKDPNVIFHCFENGVDGQYTELLCQSQFDETSTSMFVSPPNRQEALTCNLKTEECDDPMWSRDLYTVEVTGSSEVTVTIPSFNHRRDAGTWTCIVGSIKKECEKRFFDPNKVPEDPYLNFTCLEDGVDGQRSQLMCAVYYNHASTTMLLYPPNGQKVISCDLETTQCDKRSSAKEGDYLYFVEFTWSSEVTVTIFSFNRTRDTGTWACSVGSIKKQCEKIAFDPSRQPAKFPIVNLNCLEDGEAGKPTELKCTSSLIDKTSTSMSLTPPNGRPLACNLQTHVCDDLWEESVYSLKFTDKSEVTVTIPSFDHKRDAGTWACSVGSVKKECDKIAFVSTKSNAPSCFVANTSIMLQFIAILCIMTLTKNQVPVCIF